MMDARVCAWWSHRQGLDGTLMGETAAGVLSRTGWARSVGGCGPYLGMFARAGVRREEADAAVAGIAIHELPSARGCTYVVPAADYALALAVGQPFAGDEMKVARKLGVTDIEIGKLRKAIVKALSAGPLDTDSLKAKIGDAARNLGSEGVRKGITTTLPVALGLLQSAGEIRRVPVNGRLDQQRFRYAVWQPNPLSRWRKSTEESFAELARKYFSWIGPARVTDFQKFAGLGVKAAKAAVEPLKLVAVLEDRFILPEEEEAFRKFKPPNSPQYALVASLDSISQLQENLPPNGAKTDLPGHLILDRGQIVGRWEFDTGTGTIAWVSFVPRDRALEQAVRKMEAFVRDDLGDARGFSLDSPKSRAPRIQALRKAAAA